MSTGEVQEPTLLNRVRRGVSRYFLGPIVPVLIASRLTPNQVTLIGLAIVLGGAAAVGMGLLFLGGVLVLLGSAFDMFDGALARATQRASKKGAFLDSNLDRVSEIAVLLGILVYAVRIGSGTEIILTFVATAGSLMVSYVKARAEGLGYQCDVGFFTRTERVLLTAIALLIGQLLIPLWILAVLTVLTALHRFWDVWRREA